MRRLIVLGLSMVVAAACGTTVDQQTIRSAEDPAVAAEPGAELGLDSGLDGDGAPDRGPDLAAAPDGVSPDSGLGDAAGTGDSRTDPGSGGGDPAAPRTRGSAPAAPAPAARSVEVGIPYPAGADEANAAAGSNATTGDPKRQWKILIDELNGRGGLAGHQVVPVFFEIDANGDFASQAQAACAHFTEDHKVVAVLGSGINFTPPSFYDCLDRAGVSVIDGGGSVDRQQLAQRPRLLLANGMTLDRAAANTVDGLAAAGWLAPGSRVGLVTYDESSFRRAVAGGLKPALARHGASLAEEQYVAFPQSTAGYGAIATQTSNAVLRFNTQGVDRVLFLEIGGEIALFFMQAAESQQYRPVYGLSSNDGGTVLADSVPKRQLEGALGIGWVPSIDVAAADDPHARSAGRQRCLRIYADKGVRFTSTNALAIGTTQCDMARLLELAAARATVMTGDGIASGAAGLGTSFQSAVTFSTRFSRDSRDGAASYRSTAFLADCQCFRYRGAERPAR